MFSKLRSYGVELCAIVLLVSIFVAVTIEVDIHLVVIGTLLGLVVMVACAVANNDFSRFRDDYWHPFHYM